MRYHSKYAFLVSCLHSERRPRVRGACKQCYGTWYHQNVEKENWKDAKWRNEHWLEKRCEFCGNEYRIPSYKSQTSRFCSLKCRSLWRQTSSFVPWNKGKRIVPLDVQRERVNTYHRNLRKINGEKRRAWERTWYAKNRQIPKNNQLRYRHGLSLEQFHEMMFKQNKKCAICGVDFKDEFAGLPRVDHSHETGQIRGLLCLNCNAAIGHFKDNPRFLQSAIEYLYGKVQCIEDKGFPLYLKCFQNTKKQTAKVRSVLFSVQKNCCAICGEPFTMLPCIDHDHVTLRIRGLLCVPCNQGLGFFKDNVVLLELAKRYLEFWARQIVTIQLMPVLRAVQKRI